jgi:hypothetical protein
MTGTVQTTISSNVAVVLTAIQAETEAVLRHLVDPGLERVADTWFQTGSFDGWIVAIAEVGSGNTRAARPCCTDRSLGGEDWTVYQGPRS